MSDLTLRAYWRGFGDELAGNATAVFQFLTDTHELTRAFHRPQLILCETPELVAQQTWITVAGPLLAEQMIASGDEPDVLAMLLRAAQFMLAEYQAENYTRRSITQKLSQPEKIKTRTAETGWVPREFLVRSKAP